MNIKYILIFIMLFYIFIFPDKAYAKEVTVYYLKDDNVYENMLEKNFFIPFSDNDDKNIAKKIFITLDKMFNNVQNINYIPKGTKILNIERINNALYVNISREILSFGGGSCYEIGLIRQLLYNIFQFKEINSVTIYIDNNIIFFPEGSLIHNYTRKEFNNKELLINSLN